MKLFDLAVAVVCTFIGAWVVSHSVEQLSIVDFLSMRIKVVNFFLFTGFLLLWNVLCSYFGLYRSRRLSSIWSIIFDVLKATTAFAVVLLIFRDFVNIKMFNLVFILTYWISSSCIIIMSRLLLKYGLGRFRISGSNLRNLLIVGTNDRALRFGENISARRELGYVITGFVDDKWKSTKNVSGNGFKLVADLDGLPDFIRNNVIDEVLICLPLKSYYEQSMKIMQLCNEQGIIVRFLSDVFNIGAVKTKVDRFLGESLLTIHKTDYSNWSRTLKRVLDILLASILLILLSPIIIITAIAIKIFSLGPVFFVQKRLGLNKRIFNIYKFRTMILDAESKQAELEQINEAGGPVFKIKDDPRITSLGKFLRKTSIDEIPQIFNVLTGDMSLVGPRPLPIRDYNGFNQDWHRRRFSVRPGITCLWQVNGRSDISFDKWMELDMEYIDQWSLSLDMIILLKTIPSVLKGSGAV
jgi:exopolysaccharide biosynthesis polyprenyl glycosylphosphotransferase